MSKFVDLKIRSVMNDRILTLGTGTGNNRTVDLSTLGIAGLVSADIQILAGEYSSINKDDERSWVEPFLVKSPQTIYTPSEFGVSKKKGQYTIWIKTPLSEGLYFNEALAGMVEEHFENNLHLPLSGGNVITILKTYQQASITVDSGSGRIFNRVFVDFEVYYESQK